MLQLHGRKVISFTTGGLTDVRMIFRSAANNRREKSAEATVDTDTSLKSGKRGLRKSYEVSKGRTLLK